MNFSKNELYIIDLNILYTINYLYNPIKKGLFFKLFPIFRYKNYNNLSKLFSLL